MLGGEVFRSGSKMVILELGLANEYLRSAFAFEGPGQWAKQSGGLLLCRPTVAIDSRLRRGVVDGVMIGQSAEPGTAHYTGAHDRRVIAFEAQC